MKLYPTGWQRSGTKSEGLRARVRTLPMGKTMTESEIVPTWSLFSWPLIFVARDYSLFMNFHSCVYYLNYCFFDSESKHKHQLTNAGCRKRWVVNSPGTLQLLSFLKKYNNV